MVIDALKTAGNGTWFRVVERNGIDALIRERQIIRSARQDYAKATDTDPRFATLVIRRNDYRGWHHRIRYQL